MVSSARISVVQDTFNPDDGSMQSRKRRSYGKEWAGNWLDINFRDSLRFKHHL